MKATNFQIESAVKKGLTTIEIANKFGIKPQSVRWRLENLNIKLPDQRKQKRSDRIVKPFSLKPATIKQIDKIAKKTKKLKAEVIEEAIELFANYLEL